MIICSDIARPLIRAKRCSLSQAYAIFRPPSRPMTTVAIALAPGTVCASLSSTRCMPLSEVSRLSIVILSPLLRTFHRSTLTWLLQPCQLACHPLAHETRRGGLETTRQPYALWLPRSCPLSYPEPVITSSTYSEVSLQS